MKKTISTLLLTSTFITGGTVYINNINDNNEKNTILLNEKIKQYESSIQSIKSQKDSIMKDYILLKLKLNEIPKFDMSLMTVSEIQRYYIDIVSDRNLKTSFRDVDLDVLIRKDLVRKHEICLPYK